MGKEKKGRQNETGKEEGKEREQKETGNEGRREAERRESLKGERRKIGKEKKNLRTRPGGRG